MSTPTPSESSVSPASLGWPAWICVPVIVLGGAAVAWIVHKLMFVQARYAIAAVLGLGFFTLCMVFIRRLPDMLLYLMVLTIPLFTFEKSFFLRDTWVDFGTPGINIGLLDVFLLGLYGTWFMEIVVTRSRPLPRLRTLDWLVFAFLAANLLSIITTASVAWSAFEMFRLVKFGLAYFYVAHRLERRHLRPLVYALVFALLFESALGVYQHRTGKLVGIARSKGAVNAEMDRQYEVPEFEQHRRAEGTTIDSHALGVYMDILLAYPICLALCPWLRRGDRMLFAATALLGLPGLVSTFSRGGWGAFAITLPLILLVFFLWKERRSLGVFLMLALLAMPFVVIGGGQLIGKRIFRAPGEIMEARWDTILTGYYIWAKAPLTGGGTNAYFHAQRDLGMTYELTNNKPAHNLAIYLAAQTGLLGLLTYYALIIVTCVLAVRIIRWKEPILSPLALAILAGMVATQADGAIDFMAFTNQPYFMLFLSAGLIAGLLRLLPPRPASHFAQGEW